MMFIGDVWFPFVCFFFLILSATLLQCYYDEVYNPTLESAEEDATSHFPSEQVSMATDTMVFDVTFTKAELDLAIQSSEVGSELPIISGAPKEDSDAAGKVRVGDLVVSVNGQALKGHADAYAKVVELIAGAGRPITIRFQRPQPAAASLHLAVPSTPLENQFSADFHGTRLSPSVDRRPYLNDTEIAGSGVSMPQTGETRHFTFDKSSVCLMFI